MVLLLILAALAANWIYPGEVSVQSKYLLILMVPLSFAAFLIKEHRAGLSYSLFRESTLVFLVWLLMAATQITSINPARSQEVLWLFFAYACLFVTVCSLRMDSTTWLLSLLLLSAVTFYLDLFCFHQYFFGLADLSQWLQQATGMDEGFKAALIGRAESRRVFARFPLPNTLAGFLATVVPLQFFLAAASFQKSQALITSARPAIQSLFRSPWSRGVLVFQLLLSVAVLTLTQSFGGWTSFFGSAATLVLLLEKHRISWKRLAVSVVLLAALAAGWLVWISQRRGFGLLDLKAPTNPIALRWINYRVAFSIFTEFPRMGVGLGNYGTINPKYQTVARNVTQYAHNTPLQLLAESGLLFLVAVGVSLLATNRAVGGANPSDGPSHPLFQACLLASLSAWVIHNLIDINFYFPSLGGLGILLFALLVNLRRSHATANSLLLSKRSSTVMLAALLCAVTVHSGFAVRGYTSQLFSSLAVTLAQGKEYKRAATYAGKALAYSPDDASLWVLRAKLNFLASGPGPRTLDSFHEAYERAISLDPYNASYHYELSRILFALGERDRAQQARQRAATLFPAEPQYRSSFSQ